MNENSLNREKPRGVSVMCVYLCTWEGEEFYPLAQDIDLCDTMKISISDSPTYKRQC